MCILFVFLLPDAVLVHGVQVLLSGLALWGPTVQILETFPGTDALLGRLLRNVQLATKGQAAFSAVVHKQYWVAVMALKEHKYEDIWIN